MENSIQVLLVDDETDFTSALAKRLERRGFVISTAADASEAFASLEKSPVDVVVLDVKMPGMDGLQTLKAIKANFPGVEVILLTGHAGMTDAIESMYSGAFDFLIKPASLELLVCKIQDAALSSKIGDQGFEMTASHCKID